MEQIKQQIRDEIEKKRAEIAELERMLNACREATEQAEKPRKQAAVQEAGNREKKTHKKAGSRKVTPVAEVTGDLYESVIGVLADNGGDMSEPEIRAAVGAEARLSKVLAKIVADGRAIQSGNKRGTKYHIFGEQDPNSGEQD